MPLSFIKMDGAGNDFVIFDARRQPLRLTPEQVRAIAARDNPVTKGCDQVVVLEPSQQADIFMRITNADGGEVGSCGNASRCAAWLIHSEVGRSSVTIETAAGIITAEVKDQSRITVDMGKPRLGWKDIPLAEERDTLHFAVDGVPDAAAVNMGNPHMVFFVPDTRAVKLAELGPLLEHHPLFPERANISVAKVEAKDAITLRVWERGAGLTLACGTAACATLVAAHLRGLTGRKAAVHLPGGTLHIEWRADDHVLMNGPVAIGFRGTYEC